MLLFQTFVYSFTHYIDKDLDKTRLLENIQLVLPEDDPVHVQINICCPEAE